MDEHIMLLLRGLTVEELAGIAEIYCEGKFGSFGYFGGKPKKDDYVREIHTAYRFGGDSVKEGIWKYLERGYIRE